MIDDDQEAGDATLRYLELTWREVEPEEGVYAWEDISRKYGLASLREQGIHLVLRFVCDVPGKDTHLDLAVETLYKLYRENPKDDEE